MVAPSFSSIATKSSGQKDAFVYSVAPFSTARRSLSATSCRPIISSSAASHGSAFIGQPNFAQLPGVPLSPFLRTTMSIAQTPPLNATKCHPWDVISQDDKIGDAIGSFEVDWNDGRQIMEGMGGAITWYGLWALSHPNKDKILDAVFSELKPSVLRLRNTYGQGEDEGGQPGQTTKQLMKETETFVTEGRKRLGEEAFKILMCSWSPPAALKESGQLEGAGSPDGEADTLKKNRRGQFMYREFAQYWLESIKAYAKMGIEPNWISIQNEPDYCTPYHPVCSFRPSENYFFPGYYKAFEEVYETLRTELPDMPDLIGPECGGADRFITAPMNGEKDGYRANPYAASPKVAAMCNHCYVIGVKYGTEEFYRRLDSSLRNFRRQADEAMTQRLFISEFANLANHEDKDPLDLAITIYKTLTISDANLYLQWDLLWGRSNEGTMVIVDKPWKDDSSGLIDTSKDCGFEKTMSFYWFKHFCRYIRPGMMRMNTNQSPGSEGILPLVFQSKVSPDSTVILINTTDQWTRWECNSLPNPAQGKPRNVFYSTLAKEEAWVYAGQFPEGANKIWLKPKSITTLHSGADSCQD